MLWLWLFTTAMVVVATVSGLRRDLRMHRMEEKLLLVHWEACKLAGFFEQMGIEFNWRSPEELGPEHFEAFARERPKYLCGIAHTIEVEMHAVGDFQVDATQN